MSDSVDTVNTDPLQNNTSSSPKDSEEGESDCSGIVLTMCDACLMRTNLNHCVLPLSSFRGAVNQVIEWAAVFLIIY